MINKDQKPTEEEIQDYMGKQASKAWQMIKWFIKDSYGIPSETIYYGKKYGWTVRYRKSRKTLCSLFPEKGAFTVLIVLGGEEAEKALTIRDELSSRVNGILGATEQLHDGRWLWIRVLRDMDVDDVKKLLMIKKRPKKTYTRRLSAKKTKQGHSPSN